MVLFLLGLHPTIPAYAVKMEKAPRIVLGDVGRIRSSHTRGPRRHPWWWGHHYTVSATCYAQGSITASGGPVYVGEVANNFLALGTRIYLDGSVFGKRDYVVEDRIGYGSELDFYNPSEATCLWFGRREIGFRTLR
jgi:3D (Asp-Asp-Asp) domain-containing protein